MPGSACSPCVSASSVDSATATATAQSSWCPPHRQEEVLMTFPQTSWRPILGGIVGSHAYGLNTDDSDVDRMYFAAAPTVDFHGLNPPWGKGGTIVQREPEDVVVHEAAKAMMLLLKCNPSVLEMLWLDKYEVCTPLGEELISLRGMLIHQRLVRNAYLGYATEQFNRLSNAGRFTSVPVNRIAKHARHVLRLLDQGTQLYTTGTLSVRVQDPARYFAFASEVVEDSERAMEEMCRAEDIFNTAVSPLPTTPDEQAASTWLHRVRAAHFTEMS